jgi:hypothetical protein
MKRRREKERKKERRKGKERKKEGKKERKERKKERKASYLHQRFSIYDEADKVVQRATKQLCTAFRIS